MIQSVEQNVSRNLKKSYDEAIEGISEDFLPPKYEKIKKKRSRKRAEILPESPKTLEEVKIEGQKTKQVKEFVLHQEIGLVIFATTEGLKFLARSKNNMDIETFISPHRLSKINRTDGEWFVPVVWAFLGLKKLEKFFTILSKKSFEIFLVHLMPESIITGYESGVIAAVKKMFVVSTIGDDVSTFPNVYFENFKILVFKKAIKTKPEKKCAKTFQLSNFA